MTAVADPATVGVAAVRQAQAGWRANAADLGGPNTLLWHRELPLGTFELTVAHPAGVAKVLAGHSTLLSELVREPVALDRARARVRAIGSKIGELRGEHGLTTGFLAVGMASWQLPGATSAPRAPVLLRECVVKPTDASHRDYRLQLDRGVLLNPVLAHYVREEAGHDLDPEALAALSLAGHGFDARPAYQALECLCSEIPGFAIGPQLVLSTFPLAKLPFVLEHGTDPEQWASRDLVARVAGAAPASAAAPQGPLEAPASVLPLDAAQEAVLAAAHHTADGEGRVLDAPPGTGRTQVVTALLGAVATRGATALVVSESTADLDAVRRRLDALGLGDLVLTLGETPTGARRAAEEMISSLRAHEEREVAEPPTAAADPLVALATLVAHHHKMHEARPPWGVSLARAQESLATLARRSRPPHSHVRLDDDALARLDLDRLAETTTALTEAAKIGAWQRGRSEDPWYGAALAGGDDVTKAGRIVQHLVTGELTQAREQMQALCQEAGLPEPLNLTQWAERLELMGRARDTLDVFTPQVYDAPLEELISGVARGARAAGLTDRPTALRRGGLRRQARALLRPGRPPADLAGALAAALEERQAWEHLAGVAARPTTPADWEAASERFERVDADVGWLGDRLSEASGGRDLRTTHLDLLLERLLRLDASSPRLPVAARAHVLLAPLREAGLGPLVDDLARRGISTDDVPSEVELVFWASVHDRLDPSAGPSQGARDAQGGSDRLRLETAIAEVGEALSEQHDLAVATLRRGVYERVGAALADHPDEAQALGGVVDGAHGPDLRTILSAAPHLVGALRPLWMGSPLIVPATIPPDARVDTVVVLQAQTTSVTAAVPALARANRALVVGDRRGLPARPWSTADDPRAPRHTDPAADLMTVCAASWPVHSLRSDYRSVDRRLSGIGLAGFPGVVRPNVGHLAVSDPAHVVSAAVERTLGLALQDRASVLLLTVGDSASQALDDALRRRLGELIQPVPRVAVSVAPLDRLGGRWADHVVLALTAGMRLGERAALTAVRAARAGLYVVVDAPASGWQHTPAGRVLWQVVGQEVSRPGPSDGGAPASPIIADLVHRLRAEGLDVTADDGAGPHHVGLIVGDPERGRQPLLAVDTDADPGQEPTVHSVAVRDRHLRSLGWTTARVWSTDVFRDPAREVARLVHLARVSASRQGR